MNDIALEIRMELLRVRPELSLSHIEQLIQAVSRCYCDITLDNAACGVTNWQDFYDFTYVDGVALAAIFRRAELEILVFAADDSLIQKTGHLAMVDVDEFMQMTRSIFRLPDAALRFPMPEALAWLEKSDE